MDTKKIVIVTGGSQGIGEAMVARLLREGYRVVALARHRDKLLTAAEKYQEYSESFEQVSVDLSDSGAIAKFVTAWNRPLYALINNAGICKTACISDTEDPWEEVMATNLTGAYRLTRGLLTHLTDGGRIVNISSQLGLEGRGGYGAYSASKFGLIGLTKCWAKELGNRGITVNAICPGWVWSEMTDNDLVRLAHEQAKKPEDLQRGITDQLEMGVFNQPEDIAGLASYLLSPDSARISGRDWTLQSVTQ